MMRSTHPHRPFTAMFRARLLPALLALALVVVAAVMVWCTDWQARAATRAAERSAQAAELFTGVLDQETGVRGFLLNGKDAFLDPFRLGQRKVTVARSALQRTAGEDVPTLRLLAAHGRDDDRWQALALRQIALKRATPSYGGDTTEALKRKAIMDDIRAINDALTARLELRRETELSRAARRSNAAILVVLALFGGLALSVLRLESRRRRTDQEAQARYRGTQGEFTDVIQVVGSEPEAHGLLKRHLQLRIPGAVATVLTRNNSDNRLEAATEPPAGSPLLQRLETADPSACLAIRMGRSQRAGGDEERLLTCELCGTTGEGAACEPLLVGGQVIGSVLVEHAAPLRVEDELRITDSVAQAAPVLANLRNLALAERRASTDALTGLPNRRSMQDTMNRMVAQASRSMQPLTAIAIDLDRFKDINDRFGHDMGDTVLAHVAALLRGTLRASDFCGRLGGEEFVVLAPNTGVEGARILAENLRRAFERESVPGLDRDVTGSFGIAVLPDHAASGDALLRLSDRALYAAKHAGRNRVEVVDAPAAAAQPSGDPA